MPDERWLTEDEQRAWLAYRRMRTLLDLQLQRDLAADSGLSEADYDVLSSLSDSVDHRCRANTLAARLMWSTSRLAHQVGRMAARGLVDRSPALDDGRGAVIALTPEGWRTLQAAAPPHVASVRRNFIDLLTADEVATLHRIADKVTGRLSADPNSP